MYTRKRTKSKKSVTRVPQLSVRISESGLNRLYCCGGGAPRFELPTSGVALGVGDGVTEGEGLATRVGDGVATGAGVAAGVVLATALGVGVGVGLPTVPVTLDPGVEP